MHLSSKHAETYKLLMQGWANEQLLMLPCEHNGQELALLCLAQTPGTTKLDPTQEETELYPVAILLTEHEQLEELTFGGAQLPWLQPGEEGPDQPHDLSHIESVIL